MEAKEDKLYLGEKLKNIYEYGEQFLGFQRSSVKNYISICERFSVHKDGAIHMHGLLAGNFKMIDSGQTIYNMPDWKLGFSTAIELDDNVGALSRYITKYISKDFKKIFGSFYYAGGHGLIREPPIALYDIDYSEINTKEYTKYGVGYKFVELGDYVDENTAAILERLAEYDEQSY